MANEAAQQPPIELSIVETGAQQASASYLALSKALAESEARTKALTPATKAQADVSTALTAATAKQSAALMTLSKSATIANDNTARLKQAIGGTAQAMNALAGSISQAVPSLQPFQGGIQAAAGSLGGMMNLIGGGPGALIGGGLLAGVSLLTRAWANAAEAADDLAKKTAESNAKLAESLTYESRLAAIEKNKAQRDLVSSFTGGTASATQYQAKIAELQGIIASNPRDKARAQVELQNVQSGFAQGAQASQFQSDNKTALAEINDVQAGIDAHKTGPKKTPDFNPREQANKDQIAAIDAAMKESNDRMRQRDADVTAAKKLEQDNRRALDEQAIKFEIDNQDVRDQIADRQKQSWADQTKAFQEQQALQHTMQQEMLSNFQTIAGNTAQTMAKTLSDVAKGHKVSAGAIIESIGDMLVAEGTGAMVKAGVLAFTPGMQGFAGPLLAAGAIELATGLTMGAAGARSSGSASGHNKGAGGGAGTAGSGQAAPYRDTSASSSRGPVTIILTMPTMVSPSAEDGRRLKQAMREATRVFGDHA